MSQIVAHKSRIERITLNYPATDGRLTQAFIPNFTGQIYGVESLSNIATHDISLPAAIEKDISKVVTITKTTNGQAASLVLLTRIASDSARSLSAPDIGAYSGRYLYVLMDTNTVYKYDFNLLTPANYVGLGVWTVDPLVATITLPTPPTNFLWTAIQFIKQGGVERMLVTGRTNNVNSLSFFIACVIRCDNDLVYETTLTTQNAYTTFGNSGGTLSYGIITHVLYDYIQEYAYIRTDSGTNGNTVYRYNLIANTVIDLGNANFASNQISVALRNRYQFNENTLRFIDYSNPDFLLSRNTTYQVNQNNNGKWGFYLRNGYSITTGATFSNIFYFNEFGNFLGANTGYASGLYSCTEIKGWYVNQQVLMNTARTYFLRSFSPAFTRYRATPHLSGNFVEGTMMHSNTYNKYCIMVTGGFVIFDPSLASDIDFGYLIMPTGTFRSVANNQLLI